MTASPQRRCAGRARGPCGLVLVGLCCVFAAAPAAGEQPREDASAAVRYWAPEDGDRPAGHAPLGVDTGHVLARGRVMLAYRYSREVLAGTRSGDGPISTEAVLAEFAEAPTELVRQEHRAELWYGLHHRVTLRVSLPYRIFELESTSTSGAVKSRSEGIGDLELHALVPFIRNGGQSLHLSLGLGVPTGELRERGDSPGAADRRLPYAMQPGGGTVALLPGVTYRAHFKHGYWGGQLRAAFRFGEGPLDYRLGDRYGVTLWGAWEWARWLSTSIRLSAEQWSTVQGEDDELAALALSPADLAGRQGGRVVSLHPGLNLRLPRWLSPRLAIEASVPVFESLDGPQLERDWGVRTAWRWTF